MGKQNTNGVQKLKDGGNAAEQQAEMFADMGLAPKEEIRKSLASGGLDAAKALGVSQEDAQVVIDGVLAKFDAHFEGNQLDGEDDDAESFEDELAEIAI